MHGLGNNSVLLPILVSSGLFVFLYSCLLVILYSMSMSSCLLRIKLALVELISYNHKTYLNSKPRNKYNLNHVISLILVVKYLVCLFVCWLVGWLVG